MRIGRTRREAAKLLTTFFSVPVLPEHVQPVTGFWKKEDVYRWELLVYGLTQFADQPKCYGCWESLTSFVRDAKKNGIELQYKGREIGACAPALR